MPKKPNALTVLTKAFLNQSPDAAMLRLYALAAPTHLSLSCPFYSRRTQVPRTLPDVTIMIKAESLTLHTHGHTYALWPRKGEIIRTNNPLTCLRINMHKNILLSMYVICTCTYVHVLVIA